MRRYLERVLGVRVLIGAHIPAHSYPVLSLFLGSTRGYPMILLILHTLLHYLLIAVRCTRVVCIESIFTLYLGTRVPTLLST